MKRFVEGADRGQSTLFPECLEDWIDEVNSVRVIDVFVDEFNLGELGFGGVDPKATGRPWYHPSGLLKSQPYPVESPARRAPGKKMRQRRETVEHPFGTIKARMGATHLAAAYDPWKEATAPKTVNQFTSIIAAAEA